MGISETEPIRLQIGVLKRIEKATEPRNLLGISLGLSDNITNRFAITQHKEPKKSLKFDEGFRDQENYTFYVSFDIDFNV